MGSSCVESACSPRVFSRCSGFISQGSQRTEQQQIQWWCCVTSTGTHREDGGLDTVWQLISEQLTSSDSSGALSPLCLPATRPSQSRSTHKLLLLQPLDPQDTAQPPSTHTVLFTLSSTKIPPTCWEKKTSVLQRLTSSAVSQWCSTSSRKSSRDFSPVQRWSSFLSASCSRVWNEHAKSSVCVLCMSKCRVDTWEVDLLLLQVKTCFTVWARAHTRGGVYCVWPITDMDSLTDSRASYFTTRIKLLYNKNQRRTNTWSRIKETQLQLLNAGRTAGKTSGIVSMCKLQRPLVAFGKDIWRDHDIITCVNEINNSRPRDLNLLFTNKTSGREEASWWETFESQDVASITSFSLTHTVSLSLRTHTVSLTLRTHTVSLSLRTHTVSLTLRTHTVSLSLRTPTVSLTLRTHTVSLSLRTHTVSEDTHCLTDSEDTHCLTDSEDTHWLTVSEDTHCCGNLWHHYSIQTQGSISRKLTESIWCFGDRMSLERLRCSGWVSGWDQLNQPDVDLNFPDPSL